MIGIENLHLDLGGKAILRGIDLHLQPSDIYGLLGSNGAGKSSTIFTLLGLRERSRGQISVLGHDRGRHAAAIRCSVGVMPEKYRLLRMDAQPSLPAMERAPVRAAGVPLLIIGIMVCN